MITHIGISMKLGLLNNTKFVLGLNGAKQPGLDH